jgi:hypothetical protein
MEGILVKCSAGVGCMEEQDQKIAAFGSSYTSEVAFLQTKKKALLSKTYLNFGARGGLENNINYLISID